MDKKYTPRGINGIYFPSEGRIEFIEHPERENTNQEDFKSPRQPKHFEDLKHQVALDQ